MLLSPHSVYPDTASENPRIAISAGLEGRGYWGVAERFKEVAAEAGVAVDVLESQGSLENLQRLGDRNSPVSLGLTQTDAFRHYLRQNPGLTQRLKILESIGKECVFIIASKKSGIRSDADLQQDRDYKLAIQSPDSGVAITFAHMQLLEPKLRNVGVVYKDTEQAIRDMHTGDDDTHAIMLVHRPKVKSPELRFALENREDFVFVAIDDGDFNDKLPNGDPVYEFLNVPLLRSGWIRRASVKTICTKGLLVSAPDKLSAQQRSSVQHFIDYQWMQIYPTPY